MKKYRKNLPQLSGKTFITDGGMETTLVFENGFDLPEFAAFTLLKEESGKRALRDYCLPYIDLAKRHHFGLIIESATWRASKGWGKKLGYDEHELEKANHQSIELLAKLRSIHEDDSSPIVISGCIGPQGDGYRPDFKMSTREAQNYHITQIKTLSETDCDLISAFTLNYAEEAIGITHAAQTCDTPVVISFTLETDGRLPSGQPLGAAIEEVDGATNKGPAYYMINCAHPSHFRNALSVNAQWKKRILGVRANASCKSHAELDQAEELDSGNPTRLSHECIDLVSLLPNLNIFGGCCGTDIRHLQEICARLEDSVKRPVRRLESAT